MWQERVTCEPGAQAFMDPGSGKGTSTFSQRRSHTFRPTPGSEAGGSAWLAHKAQLLVWPPWERGSHRPMVLGDARRVMGQRVDPVPRS